MCGTFMAAKNKFALHFPPHQNGAGRAQGEKAPLGVFRPRLGVFTPSLGLNTPSDVFFTPCAGSLFFARAGLSKMLAHFRRTASFMPGCPFVCLLWLLIQGE